MVTMSESVPQTVVEEVLSTTEPVLAESPQVDEATATVEMPKGEKKASSKPSRAKKETKPKIAAKSTKKEPAPKKSGTTKADKARKILADNVGKQRKDIMKLLRKIPLSEPAASTYYYKYKDEVQVKKETKKETSPPPAASHEEKAADAADPASDEV